MTDEKPLRKSVMLAVSFVALLWSVKLFETIVGVDFHQLAVYPRHLGGLLGVLTAPLIHGSWQHLVANSLPTIVLGSMLCYGYPRSRFPVFMLIWLLSGLGVWLFARSSYHLGASGLTHGIFFYLFVSGILRRDRRSAALLMVAFYFYGGMLLTIFPRDPTVSFESHLFGAMAGVACAFLFRHWDPGPQRKRYAWQDQAADAEEDPVIGDQWRTDSDGLPPDR
jgi:membrane associated rhomboid family serine protease